MRSYRGLCVGGPKDGGIVESKELKFSAVYTRKLAVGVPYKPLENIATVTADRTDYRFERLYTGPDRDNPEPAYFGLWCPTDKSLREIMARLLECYHPAETTAVD